jgi:hypothetical protein
MFGIVGGAIFTLAIAISSSQLSSSSHRIASCYCGSTSKRLLILDGILVQLSQNSAHTNDFFLHQNFLTLNNFHALLFKLCPHKHLNTALDGLLLLIITVNIILGWDISWDYVYVLIIPLVDTAPFVVSSIIIIMYIKNQNITPLPFF